MAPTKLHGPTVYVVQETMRRIRGEWRRIHDLTPALIYGKLQFLVDGQQYLPISVQPIIRELKTKLKNYSDIDYLLLIGDPVLIGLATLIAAEMNRGKVNFLKWDRETSQYLEIRSDIYKK
jgi:hypothetical protein